MKSGGSLHQQQQQQKVSLHTAGIKHGALGRGWRYLRKDEKYLGKKSTESYYIEKTEAQEIAWTQSS